MKFNITLARDEEAMGSVECPAIPGCVSQGETKDEALENIKDAIGAIYETYRFNTNIGFGTLAF